MLLRSCAALLTLLLAISSAAAESKHENYFASVYREGSKIGTIHYTITTDKNGEIEELRTKISVSVLGIKVYSFTQHLHERWSGGELQKLTGTTNDDGDKYDIALTRLAKEYDATVNGKDLTFPHDAFPRSPWHYRITKHTQLINLTNFKLQNVKIKKSSEDLKLHGKTIPAQRFDFSGDWEAVVWYDQKNWFLKSQFVEQGNTIVVEMDE